MASDDSEKQLSVPELLAEMDRFRDVLADVVVEPVVASLFGQIRKELFEAAEYLEAGPKKMPKYTPPSAGARRASQMALNETVTAPAAKKPGRTGPRHRTKLD